MTKEELKQYIDENVYENQDGEITGESLNAVLKAIVDDGGTEVEANPTGEATTNLNKIKIGKINYKTGNPFAGEVDATDAERLQALANVSNQSPNTPFDGKMGYIILKPQVNDDLTSSFAAQIEGKENYIFEIRDVFDLGSTDEVPVTVTIPANCTLKFNGGCVKNGTITLDNTKIENGNFVDVLVTGTIAEDYVFMDWFSVSGESMRFDAVLQAVINLSNENLEIEFANDRYPIHTPVCLKSNRKIFSRCISEFYADGLTPTVGASFLAPMFHDYDAASALSNIVFDGVVINAYEYEVARKDANYDIIFNNGKADVYRVGYCIRLMKSSNVTVNGCSLIGTASNLFTANGSNCFDIYLKNTKFIGKRVKYLNEQTDTVEEVNYDMSLGYIGGGYHEVTNCIFTSDTDLNSLPANGGFETHGFNSVISKNSFSKLVNGVNCQFLTFSSPNLKAIQTTIVNNEFHEITNCIQFWSSSYNESYMSVYSSFGNVYIGNNHAQPNGSFVRQDSTRQNIDYVNVTIADNVVEYSSDIVIGENPTPFGVINITNTYWTLKGLYIHGNTFNRVPFSLLRLRGVDYSIEDEHITYELENVVFFNNTVMNLFSYPYRENAVEIYNQEQLTRVDSFGISSKETALFYVMDGLVKNTEIKNNTFIAGIVYAPKMFFLSSDVVFRDNSFTNGTIEISATTGFASSFTHLTGDLPQSNDYFESNFRGRFFKLNDTITDGEGNINICTVAGSNASIDLTQYAIKAKKIGTSVISFEIGTIPFEVGDIINCSAKCEIEGQQNTVFGRQNVRIDAIINNVAFAVLLSGFANNQFGTTAPIGFEMDLNTSSAKFASCEFSCLKGTFANTDSLPQNKVVGATAFVSDLGKELIWDGSNWVNSDGTPNVTYSIDKQNVSEHIELSDGELQLIGANKPYLATLEAKSGYSIDNVIVEMGGADITSFVYNNGVIYIAGVTGNIDITASVTSNP